MACSLLLPGSCQTVTPARTRQQGRAIEDLRVFSCTLSPRNFCTRVFFGFFWFRDTSLFWTRNEKMHVFFESKAGEWSFCQQNTLSGAEFSRSKQKHFLKACFVSHRPLWVGFRATIIAFSRFVLLACYSMHVACVCLSFRLDWSRGFSW